MQKLDPQYDVRASSIFMYIEWKEADGPLRYVKTVHPRLSPEDLLNRDALHAHYKAVGEEARELWLRKYDQPMPEDVMMQWAEQTPADCLPYDGTVALSPQEWEVVQSVCRTSELTLAMLWLVVEGCGWRPGQPVPVDAPEWELIRAEGKEDGGYLEIVRSLLGMPD
jgi:hypothetical protein